MDTKNKVYKITLADGTDLTDLRLNGCNFISETEVNSSVFVNNCSPVVINDGETDEVHTAMELIHITKMSDGFWFALRDLTRSELEAIKNRSDIEYIALMCDVEL